MNYISSQKALREQCLLYLNLVVESSFLSCVGKCACADGSGTVTLCGHLVDLTGLAGLLNTVDNLDRVETDVVVATGTATVDESVAHISKTYAAAGRIEAVEKGKIDLLRGDRLAESLIVVSVINDSGNLGLGHLTCLHTLTLGSGTVADNGDGVTEAVGVTEVEYTVGTCDLECVCSLRVGGDVECTNNAALELESRHKCGGSINFEVLTVLGVLGVYVLTNGIDVTAEACYSLDGAEEVDHLMDVVTAEVEGEASAVMEGEEEVLGREIEEGSLGLIVGCALCVDGDGLTDDTVVEILARRLLPCTEECVGRCCEGYAVFLCETCELKSLLECGSHHLLAVNVLACLKSAAGDLEMRLGICKVNDNLDILICEHLLEGHLLYAVLVYHVLCAGVDKVAYCNYIDNVESVHHVVHVSTTADTAAADNTDFNFSHWPCFPFGEEKFYRLYSIINIYPFQ